MIFEQYMVSLRDSFIKLSCEFYQLSAKRIFMYYSNNLHQVFNPPIRSAQPHAGWEHTALQIFKGVSIATAAISLSPFIFNQDELGQVALANTLSFCSTGEATGLTGVVSGIMSQIPLIGGYLATGGIVNGIASLTIGLGGVALARMLEKNNRPTAAKIVRWASIATSVLVSLPAILPALGMGFHFLGLISDNDVVRDWAYSAFEVLGKIGSNGAAAGMMQSGSALLASAGHLIACGASAASSVWVAHHASDKTQPATRIHHPIETSRIQNTQSALAV